MKLLAPLTVAVAVLSFAAACGSENDSNASSDGRVAVVASFYPLAEAAAAIGGDLVEVTNLTPAGTEPHDLELSPRQVDQLQDADVVLYLGQGFQPAIEEIAERRDDGTLDVLVDLPLEEGAAALDEHGEDGHGEEEGEHAEEEGEHAEDAATEDAHADEEDHGDALDPHFWLDPTLMASAVDQIEAALAEAAPDDAESFAANAERYQEQLADLDADFETGLAECERRTVVVSHAAFHYLTDRYDLEQHALAGLSPEAEPSPARLAELTDVIREEGVTTVFYETLVAPDVAETLAREAGVETAVLNPLEGLTRDDLEADKDYAAVMRDNLEALRTALGCS